MYTVSQKETPLRLLHYISAYVDETLPSCLPFTFSPRYQFWSTYLNIYENRNTFYNINF